MGMQNIRKNCKKMNDKRKNKKETKKKGKTGKSRKGTTTALKMEKKEK